LEPATLALIELGRSLERERYRFVTVTPETHRRVNARAQRLGLGRAADLRDVFGWNRPFAPGLLAPRMLELLQAADMLAGQGDALRSRVRFASIGERLFAHSAFPTTEADAVFFGPDTYRFCSLLGRWAQPSRCLVDVGCGSGAGGISLIGRAERIVLADINTRALELARVNAALAGVNADVVASDVLDSVDGDVDLVIANPPYMRDEAGRVYRDGGGAHGEALALRILAQAFARLRRGGAVILYTGAVIVGGQDTFFAGAEPLLHEHAADFVYQELDPDVFGDELEQPAYRDAERIAAVGLYARRG
jgi:hypothetical protein